jgi:hypothetical protein
MNFPNRVFRLDRGSCGRPACGNLIGLIAIVVCTWPAAAAFAAEVTYTVDPSQSMLTASGTIDGRILLGQQVESVGPDGSLITYQSLVTSYTGTITADRDTSAKTLQITGGNIVAQNNGPFSGPYYNPPLADYGVAVGDFSGAVRNFSFVLSGPVMPSSGSFDAAELSGMITSGEFDFSIASFNGEVLSVDDFSSPIVGDLTLASANASITDADGVETIAIPVNTNFITEVTDPAVFSAPLPLYLDLSGVIVATSEVPEPAILELLAISGLFLIGKRRSLLILVSLMCFAVSAPAAFAAEITYTIDPTQSVLTLSGSADGFPYQEQQVVTGIIAGLPPMVYQSLVTSYTGTITAERDPHANTLQINGGNIAAVNGGPYAAPTSFVPTTYPPPADYGFEAAFPDSDFLVGPSPSLLGAIRDFSFLPSSSLLEVATGFDVS